MQYDFSIKKIERKEKRGKYKSIFKMRYVWISISILFVSLLLITLSWIVKSYEWLSNMFLSVGASAITGCVIYYLSNKRLNTINKLQFEISSLQELKDRIEKCIYFSLYSLAAMTVNDNTDENVLFRDVMHEIHKASNELPESVFLELGFDADDPFDRDKIEFYIDVFRIKGKEIATSVIKDTFRPILERIKELMFEKKKQLAFSANSVL